MKRKSTASRSPARQRNFPGNREQLERLLQAGQGKRADAWNAWRLKNLAVPLELYAANLSDCHLREFDLDGVNLTKTNLARADLRRASFQFGLLHHANLSHADARGAGFSHVQFDRANLKGTRLDDADLRDTRLDVADLTDASLRRARLRNAVLAGVVARRADFRDADLSWVNLSGEYESGGDFGGALFQEADLSHAYLAYGDFRDARFSNANMAGANLTGADLRGADLRKVDLQGAILSGADLRGATLRGADVSGVAVWGVRYDESDIKDGRQAGLQIHDWVAHYKEEYAWGPLTVDNIELAHFMALVIQNPKLAALIDATTSKTVLLLGRFTGARKKVLERLREELPYLGYAPIIFDFEGPASRDTIETISTLAGLSKFVIADLSKPKSTPLETYVIVPHLSIPFVPIVERGEQPFSMLRDMQKKYYWVLPPVTYENVQDLVDRLDQAIVKPAERMFARIGRQRRDLVR